MNIELFEYKVDVVNQQGVGPHGQSFHGGQHYDYVYVYDYDQVYDANNKQRSSSARGPQACPWPASPYPGGAAQGLQEE